MQQAATTDPTGLARIPDASPLGLALGTLFVLAVALVLWLLKRRNGHEPEPRQQGSPFIAAPPPAAARATEHEPEPVACCDVATAVRDYFNDPPLSVLKRFGELIGQSDALARLREVLEADMEQKLEERLTAHRAQMETMMQAHQGEMQRLLMTHVLEVNRAISSENKNQTREVLEAVKALRDAR